ncbi:hypothetical protein BH23BAC1_BH23BAC1_22620 [soil metagenome]
MMNTKLTLTIDKEIIEQSKKYAKIKGRSLSELIENYLKVLISNERVPVEFTPKVNKLKGSISLPEDFDSKKAYSIYLIKKHKL